MNIQENNIKHINILETTGGPRQAQHDTQVRMQYTYARDFKNPQVSNSVIRPKESDV
jgi:hypothetical protein